MMTKSLLESRLNAMMPTIVHDDPSMEKKLSWLRSNIIGGNAEFSSPFGQRRITYADTTASGRSLRYIEDYIVSHVLPFYGNTHTSDSYVGYRSTRMMNEASQYIKKCLGGTTNDALLFCGSGTTAAIKRLQEVMGIAIPSILRDRAVRLLREEERWVVFVGPYEHHSNLLSWRESLAEVVEIGVDEYGLVDMEALGGELERYKDTNRPMLGSFSACSNVTGICSDTRAIARLLHEYGAFACFDFASSGPYVEIDMRSGEAGGYDAIFLSPHKFIGGPGSPGVLLMNKQLYQLQFSSPSTCGGGTVSYVNGFNEEDTLYFEDIEERENAGTPPIIQTIRASLSFWVKEYIGYKTIEEQEEANIQKALKRFGRNKNIRILGNTSTKRHAILSFLVYPTERGKPLHGPFVAKLLNDLFGIQARGGCACAGPYGHILLGVDRDYSLAFRSSVQKGYVGVKPGWTRISFPYYMSNEEVEFILAAVEFIAKYGERFLVLYHYNWKTGIWSFKKGVFKEIINMEKQNIESIDEDSKLSSLLQELTLKCADKGKEFTKDSTFVKASEQTFLYASYLAQATYIFSMLPKLQYQRRIPEDLDIELPFAI
ncbi:putative cysteine desulfurase [Drosera capensis]